MADRVPEPRTRTDDFLILMVSCFHSIRTAAPFNHADQRGNQHGILLVYKIILFDQRGCGKSQPSANLDDNTTWSLVADMDAIRKATQVSKWVLFGGSWGSTLALVYAQEYPERVAGLILRGIFLLRKQELDWLYGRNGAAMLYPEAFQSYLGGLPEHKRNEQCLMTTYYEILASDKDTAERNHAAKAWSQWELALSCFPRTHEDADGVLQPMEEFEEVYSDLENLIFARIEAHFFVHGGFLKEDGELLSEERMAKVRHIKTCIVQGRWDMVCPRKSAYDLKQMLSESAELIIVENAGHSTFEPGIEQALLEASDRFGEELRDVV